MFANMMDCFMEVMMPEKVVRKIPKGPIDGELKIPLDLLQKYKIEPRLVIRHPWVIGIPAPEMLFDDRLQEMLDKAQMDVFFVPRA